MMDWAEKVKARLNESIVQESLSVAAIDALPKMGVRIFEEGQNKKGEDIGQYSTKKTYISKTNMRNTSPGEETSGGKSKRFEGGYKQYKSELDDGKYNLRNFGVMMRDFYAPAQTLTGNSIKYDFKQDRNLTIADNYTDVFGLSQTEIEHFGKVFLFELQVRLFQ